MKCKIIVFVLTLLILLFPNLAVMAQNPEEEALQKTASELYDGIMCPLCPGQSIWHSSNVTSRQMQDLVLKKLRQGETKEEILEYFASRYGERILAKPKTEGFNVMLWFLPGVFGALAVIVIYLLIRRWSKRARVKSVTHVEEAQLTEYEERMEKELKEFEEGY